jgi:hypothetical protein
MKKEKIKLLKQIDVAANSTETSDEQKQLLSEVKEQLKSAISRKEFIDIAYKVAQLIISLTKILIT